MVKRAIETKDEMGDYIRSYSESQFNKHHSTPKVREGERREGGRGRRKAEERDNTILFYSLFLRIYNLMK